MCMPEIGKYKYLTMHVAIDVTYTATDSQSHPYGSLLFHQTHDIFIFNGMSWLRPYQYLHAHSDTAG